MQNMQRKNHIRKLTIIALFTALSYVVMIMIHFPVQFLTLDVKDAVTTLCGLAFGPLAALFAAVVVPLLELVTVSDTGWYGLVMNIIGSVSLSVTASLIYKYKKNFMGAVMGLISGVCVMVAMMMLANLFITPFYMSNVMGIPMKTKDVAEMIPTLLLPFNLVKGVLNASITMMLYKPVSTLLQKTGFLPKTGHTYRMDRRTIAVIVVSLVLIIASFVIIFHVLGGSFEWGIHRT